MWNWQQPEWPDFEWNADRLAAAEERFLIAGGVVLGSAAHIDPEGRTLLQVEAITHEALTSSEIEGEILDRNSVQASVRRELGLDPNLSSATPAETGVAEMMVDMYKTWPDPLGEEQLFAWHGMLMRGRQDLAAAGQYRSHADPMQIISARLDRHQVHFEAPPSAQVPQEMAQFLAWFDRTAPGAPEALPAITRAAVAHIYFESIHPFEDGNGRLGRAISEKALAQGLGDEVHTGIAATILRHRRSYYDALGANNRGLDVGEWVAWFAGIALEAQQHALARTEFLIAKTRLLDRLAGSLNERQERVLLRMLREGPRGFEGGLSAGNYVRIASTSPATARRDLGDLVEKRALRRTGERRYARYHLTIPTRRVHPVTIDEHGRVEVHDGVG